MPRPSSPARPRPPRPKPKQRQSTPHDQSPQPLLEPPPLPLQIKPEPIDEKITILVRPRPPVVLTDLDEPWKHPDELEYIRPTDWSETQLISCLLENAFDVPPRLPPGSPDPWCTVTSRNGMTVIVPKGYRLPLMFAMKFQWESLRLVLTSPQRENEWKDYKFDILHVSRLCAGFLNQARNAMVNNGLDKTWRCSMFDRALTRYYRRWLVNREEFLMGFWKEFEEEEYEEDVLKKDWNRFVLKGHKGFHLTKEECADGLSFQTITSGLEQRSDGRYYWVLPPVPPPALPTPDTEKRKTRKGTGKRKRGVDKDKGKKKGKEEEKEKEPPAAMKTMEVARRIEDPNERPVPDEEQENKAREAEEAKQSEEAKEGEEAKQSEEGKQSEEAKANDDSNDDSNDDDETGAPWPVKRMALKNDMRRYPVALPIAKRKNDATPADDDDDDDDDEEVVEEETGAPWPVKRMAMKNDFRRRPVPVPVAKRKNDATSVSTPPAKKARIGEEQRVVSSSPLSRGSSVVSEVGSPAKEKGRGKGKGRRKGRRKAKGMEKEKDKTNAKEGNEERRRSFVEEKEMATEKEKQDSHEKKEENGASEERPRWYVEEKETVKGTETEVSQEREKMKEGSEERLRSFMEKWGGDDDDGGGGRKGDEGGEESANEDSKKAVAETMDWSQQDVILQWQLRRKAHLHGGQDVQRESENEGRDEEDDEILQVEGLAYPEPEAMEVDSDAYVLQIDKDKENEKDDENEKEKGAGASATESSALAPQVSVSSDVPSVSPPPPPSPDTPAVDIAPTTSLTSTTTPSASSTTASTTASTSTTTQTPPLPTITLPSSAPPPAQPSIPISVPIPDSNANANVKGKLRGFFIGRQGLVDSNSPAGTGTGTGIGIGTEIGSAKGNEKDTSPPSPAESTSIKDSGMAVGAGGTSLEKRQSSWDARVIKAVERAKALKVALPRTVNGRPPGLLVGAVPGASGGGGGGVGASNGGVGSGVGGVLGSPRAAYYVPQVPQWERGLQRGVSGVATSYPVHTPPRPDAPVLSSTPSTSGSSTGSGSGSTALPALANQLQKTSLTPATEPEPEPAPSPLPPASAPSDDTADSTPTVTDKVPETHPTETVPPPEMTSESSTAMDVNPPSPRVETCAPASDPVALVTETDAPTESPAPLSLVQTLTSQTRPQSPPQSTFPAPTSSNDQLESQSQSETLRLHPRPSPREILPLPGPPLSRRNATFEEYQLTTPAWSGYGSSDHGNDGDAHEPEGTREDIINEHEHERDLQHNYTEHRYEREVYHDNYHLQSATPDSPPHRRYRPYPSQPPSRPRYSSSFAPSYYPQPLYDYPSYFLPSASAPYRRPSQRSVNGESMSEVHSPVLPDINPEGAEVDGSPVATRIVSIVQDTMARLADVLSASGPMRENGSIGERRRERSFVASGSEGSVSMSAEAGVSRYRGQGDAQSLKLEDVLGEIRSLKEEHKREVSTMRHEIEGLRKQVQKLEGQNTKEQDTNVVDVDGKLNVESGAIDEPSSSLTIDLTGDARDETPQVNRPVSRINGGVVHNVDTSTIINVRDSDSPSLALRQENSLNGVEGGKGKEKEVTCPPRIGGVTPSTPSNDGIPMSPSHNGLPLPIKSQRKGRMFAPIDMTDESQ